MAVTLNPPADTGTIYASIPIVKWDETPDGIMVYGRATTGDVDSDEQTVDPLWSGPALEKWLNTGGNLRCQHNPQLYPAGKGVSVEIDRDGDGAHWVKSLVVEPTAMKLVKAGVLRAYSVGITKPIIRRDVTGKARGGIVTGGDNTEIAELSLVDRPANSLCGVTLVKAHADSNAWTYGDLEQLLADAVAEAEAIAKAAEGPDMVKADPADQSIKKLALDEVNGESAEVDTTTIVKVANPATEMVTEGSVGGRGVGQS